MKKTERTIVLDKALAKELATLAGEDDLSHFVNNMLRLELQRQRIEELEEVLARDHGPLTPQTKAWGDTLRWPR